MIQDDAIKAYLHCDNELCQSIMSECRGLEGWMLKLIKNLEETKTQSMCYESNTYMN